MIAIDMLGVKKEYTTKTGERVMALQIPRLRIVAGTQTLVVGPSGAGKTTLLNLLSGLLRPTEGTIKVTGVEITALVEKEKDRFRGKNVGYIFQNFSLLHPFTAKENVLLGMAFSRRIPSSEREEQARRILDRVGLGRRLNHRPSELSIGEQQRIAIARALANNPPVILADEPTGALDAENRKEIVNLLKELCSEEERTLLIVSHDSWMRGQFEETLTLSKGQLV